MVKPAKHAVVLITDNVWRDFVGQPVTEGQAETYSYWCVDCEAGGDDYPTKEEAAERAYAHAEDPENVRDWSTV